MIYDVSPICPLVYENVTRYWPQWFSYVVLPWGAGCEEVSEEWPAWVNPGEYEQLSPIE
jgi:hypothetical protein